MENIFTSSWRCANPSSVRNAYSLRPRHSDVCKSAGAGIHARTQSVLVRSPGRPASDPRRALRKDQKRGKTLDWRRHHSVSLPSPSGRRSGRASVAARPCGDHERGHYYHSHFSIERQVVPLAPRCVAASQPGARSPGKHRSHYGACTAEHYGAGAKCHHHAYRPCRTEGSRTGGHRTLFPTTPTSGARFDD
ncbi:hypothetical protein IEO21_08960 [Rhodonia placenta]|uniref:Uncharacterized protein n=1 Tax=Rhodonia placenta TaxID=104341 RepID=A0A8H7TYB7_9APHY|nr:hypothetical protein IEO21_08960 [Postia placenta]